MENDLESKITRLHLGCGETYLDGYVNIDFPQEKHTIVKIRADKYVDIKTLDYGSSSIDEIRNHHFLEHFNRAEALALLMRWRRWLKVGGSLVIETPDSEEIMREFLREKDFSSKMVLERHLFGSEEAAWATHYDGWFDQKYRRILSILGFDVVKMIKFKNNIAKKLNYHGVALFDAIARLTPDKIKETVGINTLPNILCVARKTADGLDEKKIGKDILSWYLVGQEKKNSNILEVWFRDFENLLDGV